MTEQSRPRRGGGSRRSADALRRSEERYALAARGANDGLWDWDLLTDEIYFSDRWKSMLGFEESELSDTVGTWFDRVHPEDLPQLRSLLNMHLEAQTPHFEGEYRILVEGGSYRWMLARGLAVRDENGAARRIAGSQTDITERKLAVEQLLRNAFHDGLTGLPNRMLFMDRLDGAMKRSQRREGQFAVLYIDLDRFKAVNDSLGHQVGDELLIEISRRLESCVRPGDTVARLVRTVARLGGDEFTVLVEGIEDVAEAIRIAERIGEAIEQPCHIGPHEIVTSASIGIACSVTGLERPEDLLNDADTAMYRAKMLGKARHQVCDQEMHERAVARLAMERDLRAAIGRNELRVVYQPIVALRSGAVSGFEALVRWEHPERGLVYPNDFIALAEDAGLVHGIGLWVMRHACAQLAAWHRRSSGWGEMTMSVNISGKDFAYAGYANQLIEIFTETGVDPSRVRLEITETAIVKNLDAATPVMKELESKRIRFSLDDFGTGYSSFSYLQRFPIDTLKIDRSFVSGMRGGNEDERLVGVMVPLARILGMESVAEGVETAEQFRHLRDIGCAYGQGFYFSEPLSAEDVEKFMEKKPRW
jgi:diguanylate cyclase (GGDEF)-like protein/PAS domain S-box-containing protein